MRLLIDSHNSCRIIDPAQAREVLVSLLLFYDHESLHRLLAYLQQQPCAISEVSFSRLLSGGQTESVEEFVRLHPTAEALEIATVAIAAISTILSPADVQDVVETHVTANAYFQPLCHDYRI